MHRGAAMWGQPPKPALSAVEVPALSLSKGAVRRSEAPRRKRI
ncbi:hypothetical protein SBA1_1140014 [Candidatus Sulfotelmatobacter kueseliae]|uniref:Uncharacterized protein n=1 Tax=Candidatus Sulfotelmatobacter kueseliae TaxID=2042962 RepID=A0A2U3K095_9BACT|nr:hypothetical protein SBA1_1140014 [Candidatus Sulfotelmatobacter kueseliae]